MSTLPVSRRGFAVLCTFAVAACTGAMPPPASTPLPVTGLWRIDQARSEPLLDRRQARLDFGADGRLTGHTSCNTLRGSYTLDGAALKIGPIAITRMACGESAREQEDRVLTALELARTARVRPDGLLELRDEEGRGVLRGTRFSTAP
jgi:heat shock protein HslJ